MPYLVGLILIFIGYFILFISSWSSIEHFDPHTFKNIQFLFVRFSILRAHLTSDVLIISMATKM